MDLTMNLSGKKIQIMANNATQKPPDPDPVPTSEVKADRWQALIISAIKPIQNQYFDIPIIENINFQGRNVLLERLRDRLFASPVTQRRVVLCGLEGIGKSALAAHFATQFHTEYEGVSWVSAEAQTSLERSYNSLSDMVQSNFRTWCSDSRR
jgi:hypothetical protein